MDGTCWTKKMARWKRAPNPFMKEKHPFAGYRPCLSSCKVPRPCNHDMLALVARPHIPRLREPRWQDDVAAPVPTSGRKATHVFTIRSRSATSGCPADDHHQPSCIMFGRRPQMLQELHLFRRDQRRWPLTECIAYSPVPISSPSRSTGLPGGSRGSLSKLCFAGLPRLSAAGVQSQGASPKAMWQSRSLASWAWNVGHPNPRPRP